MNTYKRISKLMSLVLRHQPEFIDVELDENGWAKVDELIQGINKKGVELEMNMLKDVVKENPKQRFSFNDDFTLIRANQGHSVEVDVQLTEKIPPSNLYHGTVSKFMKVIRTEGLKKMSRNHVHLSDDVATATKVGERRGKPVILKINSYEMSKSGFSFYVSKNGVWLTDHVPAEYITLKK